MCINKYKQPKISSLVLEFERDKIKMIHYTVIHKSSALKSASCDVLASSRQSAELQSVAARRWVSERYLYV